MQKTTLMKVVSILLIIGGAYRLLSFFTSFGENAKIGVIGIVYSLAGVVYLAVQLAAGILGIQKKDNLDLCKKLAFAVIGMVIVVEGVLNFLVIVTIGAAAGAAGMGGIAGLVTSVVAIVFGLILPVLYLLGINQSARNTAQTNQASV